MGEHTLVAAERDVARPSPILRAMDLVCQFGV